MGFIEDDIEFGEQLLAVIVIFDLAGMRKPLEQSVLAIPVRRSVAPARTAPVGIATPVKMAPSLPTRLMLPGFEF